jgi:hypothetical protein
MKIRIMGTEDECRDVAALLPAIVDVLSAGGPKPSRNSPRLMFMYVEARPYPATAHVTSATQGRPDQRAAALTQAMLAQPGTSRSRRALPPGGAR